MSDDVMRRFNERFGGVPFPSDRCPDCGQTRGSAHPYAVRCGYSAGRILAEERALSDTLAKALASAAERLDAHEAPRLNADLRDALIRYDAARKEVA